MPTQLEERVARSLRDHAAQGRPIDPAPLMHEAKAQGKRIQVRRRIGSGVLAAVVVLGGGFLAVRSNGQNPSPARPEPSISGFTVTPGRNLARLPAADIPGAAARPDLVATDPSQLHLNMDALLGKARDATWRATSSFELATADSDGDGTVVVAIARRQSGLPKGSFQNDVGQTSTTAAPVTIGGVEGTYRVITVPDRILPKPGTGSVPSSAQPAKIYHFEWQPVPGVWAMAQVGNGLSRTINDLSGALRSVSKVRFDRGTPCALPIRVGAPPAGTTLTSCEVDFDVDIAPATTGVFYHAGLSYSAPRQRLDVEVTNIGVRPQTDKQPLKAGPYHVRWDNAGNAVYDDGYSTESGGLILVVSAVDKQKPWTRAQLLDVFGSIRIVGDRNRPETFQ